jgi:16S rRNA C967 or C1407 C5-methylase (RsmB/RsmF family)
MPPPMDIPYDLHKLERYRDIVGDWPAFAEASLAPLPTTLWVNTLRGSREEIAAWLADDGVETTPLAWYPRGLRVVSGRPGKSFAFLTGACHVQEEVSMMPIVLLDPRPGDSVLDLCAAPGNKSTQAAVHMEDRGDLVACEVNEGRLGLIVRNVERMALTSVATLNTNAGNLPREVGSFDRVLADVPCGCEGTTRKNPSLLHRTGIPPGSLAGSQISLLRKAIQRCTPGGRIVYSTCTYAPEENEAVVDTLLREMDGRLRLLPARIDGVRGAPGLSSWQGREYLPEVAQTLRLYPHLNDTGGFFIALLEKASDGGFP